MYGLKYMAPEEIPRFVSSFFLLQKQNLFPLAVTLSNRFVKSRPVLLPRPIG